MPEQWIPQSRAERLIAVGRSVLAISSLGAIYLEPTHVQPVTWWVLIAYAVYALALLVWTLFGPVGIARPLLVGTHAFDLALFGVINYLTAGGTSPFFVYFVFSIVCAILTFGRRGTVATALTAMMVFIVSALPRLDAHGLEVNRFVIRAAYLLVVGSLLIYLADYLQRLQADLARIARWPRSLSPTHEQLITEILREPALIFEAQRVLFAYEHDGDRYGFLGIRNGDELRVSGIERNIADLLLESGSGTFVRTGSFASLRPSDLTGPGTNRSSRSIPLKVVSAYDIEDVVATSFAGDSVRGRLLLLDGRPPLLEEMNLARIAGAVIAGRLDQHHASEQLRSGAVAQERVRVARDLHDSVLQSLTGIALQLRTIPHLMTRDRRQAEVRLNEIEEVIGTAQKELRWFIDQLHPERKRDQRDAAPDDAVSMAQRFEQQWGLTVEVDPVIHQLPIPIRYQVYTLVSEAVANAAKHASAKSVQVAAGVGAGKVRIDVADDGQGFPFFGRYGIDDLKLMKHGPSALQERVTSLGGTLFVDSTRQGSRIEIHLPLPEGS